MKSEFLVVNMIILLLLTSCIQNRNKSYSKNESEMPATKDSLAQVDWNSKLTPEQYHILREKGTELPFSGKYLYTNDKGVYKCAACNESLFDNNMKFESHCGWPSFDSELPGGKIVKTKDNTMGLDRIEISCAKCGGHLGHIFDDGPTATGKRYCVNSGSLNFEAK